MELRAKQKRLNSRGKGLEQNLECLLGFVQAAEIQLALEKRVPELCPLRETAEQAREHRYLEPQHQQMEPQMDTDERR